MILNEALTYNKTFLMLLILTCTGIRAGELCGLKWTDFDDDYHLMEVNESRTDNKYEYSTKNESSERWIPIPDISAKQLAEYHKKNPNTEYQEHVFVNRNKNLYTTQTIEKRLKTILDLILEKTGINLTFITPHYFRHTFATTGLNNGSTISDMMALMGHLRL